MVSLGTKVSFATTTLAYPIFAAEFDPYNRGYLVVGGGGGESRSGVPNQISVLDVSNRAAITTVVDIELTSDEDSVQSLASLAIKDGLITLAGINSSQADQNASRNEHFRAFDIKIPPRKKQRTDGTITQEKGHATLVGKRSIFRPERSAKKEAYQRILRLSPARKQETGSKRIGAIASGMSKPAEIVIFNATAALPTPTDILARIEVEKDNEVMDLDIAIADEDRFSVCWCTDYEILEQTLDYNFTTKRVQKTPKGPRRIHQVPTPIGSGAGVGRPKFRSLRFLDSENVIALVNRASKKGAELHIYHLYPTGPATTVLQMTLPSHVKQAVSMDVCSLDAARNGDRQIIVAVAGQDISIETYVLNYKGDSGTFSRFTPFQSFRDVHKHQMTKICFSPFHSPASTADTTKAEQDQYIRLASVSYGNTVVVDSLPVRPFNPRDRQSQYVLLHPRSQKQQSYIFIALISFMVLVAAYVGRAYLSGQADIRADLQSFWKDTHQEILNTSTLEVPDVARNMQASAVSILESTVPTAVPFLQSLQELLGSHPGESTAVIVRENPAGEDFTLDLHSDKEAYLAQDPEAKHWDDLQEEQRHYWRQKLLQAGRWAESEGETVFKGVLWSQYAGLVGAAAGEVLREL